MGYWQAVVSMDLRVSSFVTRARGAADFTASIAPKKNPTWANFSPFSFLKEEEKEQTFVGSSLAACHPRVSVGGVARQQAAGARRAASCAPWNRAVYDSAFIARNCENVTFSFTLRGSSLLPLIHAYHK